MGRSPYKSIAGFTVIEMMLVVAIAGLILLITLMAVPTLERNGRNNQRTQDVASVLAAVLRYGTRNGGGFPPDYDPSIKPFTKLSFYDSDNAHIQIMPSPPASAATPSVTTGDIIEVQNHFVCDASGSGKAVSTGAGYRDIVALYAIETSNGFKSKCQELAS